MWEAIRRNRRRSVVLLASLAGTLLLAGGAMGALVGGSAGALAGGLAGVAYATLLAVLALRAGDRLLLAGLGAQPVRARDCPRLRNVVEEMAIAAGLPRVPAVYLLPLPQPNAFAVGPDPERAAIVVTSGLVKRLRRDELQAVVAHEVAHILNQDVRFLTLAAVAVASTTLFSDLFWRSFGLGGRVGRLRRVRPGPAWAWFALAALLALLAPLAARLLYLACSQDREYLADATAARLTRHPESLARALEKIAGVRTPARAVPRALAPLYIVNPLQVSFGNGGFATHPPLEARVRILRKMAGAAYADYERAYREVQPDGALPPGPWRSGPTVPVQAPAAEPQAEWVARVREVEGMLGARADWIVLRPCLCGLRVRIPRNLERESVRCPRCGRVQWLAAARPAAAGATTTAAARAALRYRRRSEGWEAFRCACGKALQLSPACEASRLRCPACHRRIAIEPAAAPAHTA